MTELPQHYGCCGRDDLHFHEEEVWAAVTAQQAERYAALVATFGEADTHAMLVFPWTPNQPTET